MSFNRIKHFAVVVYVSLLMQCLFIGVILLPACEENSSSDYTEKLGNPLFNRATTLAGAARLDNDINKAGDGSQHTGSGIVYVQNAWEANWPADIHVGATLHYQSIRPVFVAALQRDNKLIKHVTQ